MAGKRRIAAPGEPQCPEDECERPAGFATDHEGAGHCRRHDSHRPTLAPRPTPTGDPGSAETAPEVVPEPRTKRPSPGGPFDRRLTSPTRTRIADPLPTVRTILTTARAAGFPFRRAWAVATEAGLSYLPPKNAREWWDVLDDTEDDWADAYVRRGDALRGLTQ